MKYNELIACVRAMGLACSAVGGDRYQINFEIRRLANETLHWLAVYLEADEKFNYDAHSPRAIALGQAGRRIANVMRQYPLDDEGDAKASRMITIAATELPGIADALESMAPVELAEEEEPAKQESVVPAIPTGYYHPILLLSDELRANEKTRDQWKRPKIADEYYKRLAGPMKQEELQGAGGSREALREKYVNILRNHKGQLLYPP